MQGQLRPRPAVTRCSRRKKVSLGFAAADTLLHIDTPTAFCGCQTATTHKRLHSQSFAAHSTAITCISHKLKENKNVACFRFSSVKPRQYPRQARKTAHAVTSDQAPTARSRACGTAAACTNCFKHSTMPRVLHLGVALPCSLVHID